MVGTVVVIRPNATTPTKLSFSYAEELIGWLGETGIQVVDIPGAIVGQPSLWATLTRLKIESDVPPIVCYYGHGKSDRLLGDVNYTGIPLIGEHMSLIKDGFNDSWLKNCIVYTYACLSGLKLGPDAIRAGALAYYGNTEPTFVGFPETENDYSKDFAVVANTIPKALVNGYTLHEAMVIFRRTCDYYYKWYRAQDNWPNADYYEFAMMSMRDKYKLFAKRDMKWAGV